MFSIVNVRLTSKKDEINYSHENIPKLSVCALTYENNYLKF